MNCEPEVIRARFVEAAFTERYLPIGQDGRAALGRESCKGYWPETQFDFDAYKNIWDQKERDAYLADWQGRGTAKADAISRHQECMDWTAAIVTDEKRRHILWSWAFCRANGWDFGARCIKRGWARPTAYRRLTATIEAISRKFAMDGFVVRHPDDKWLRQETPSIVPIDGRQENCSSAPAIKFSPGYQTEKSRDLLTSPEAIADFVKHRDMVNAERRGLQEREAKRRAKIGAMAS